MLQRDNPATPGRSSNEVDSAYAWARLLACMLIGTIGGVGMWSVVVALPFIQGEFAVDRAGASLAYTSTMIGYAFGGVAAGRMADRFGIIAPVALASLALGLGYVASSFAATLWQFALVQGLLIGAGSSASFGPLMADVSKWFVRRRGVAVGLCACGSYIAGAVWPPVVQHYTASVGWRQTHVAIGLFCVVATLPLLFALRRRPASRRDDGPRAEPDACREAELGLSSPLVQALLCVAGLACCVAMAMPQVHIVAYCADLGYGVARGAEMLSLMLGLGVVSRIASGWIADAIGGVRTLLVGSVLQALALTLYLLFDGLASLYVISALFGLFQGGIVPSYAIIVREFFPAKEAGTRLGLVLMSTLFGMALGGWLSGAIFDHTGSYGAAFLNGLLWNALNVAIALTLVQGSARTLRLRRA